MGGFHGGHGHSGGGFHGGSHGSFHSGGSHFSSGRYTGSGGHYSGGGGGGSPLGGLIYGIFGCIVCIGCFIWCEFDFEFLLGFFGSVILALVSLARLVADKEKIKKALKEDDNVDNVDNKVYEVVQVDTKKNRIGTRVCRVFGYITLGLGLLFIFLFHTKTSIATITDANQKYDYHGIAYEEYTFRYTVDGKYYYGVGDDDLVYDYQKGRYVFDIEVGEEYPIYYYMVNPSSYSFSKEPFAPLYVILIISGSVLIIIGIVFRKKYLKSIEYVGDLNNDGKINEKDLIIYQKKKSEENLAKMAEAAKKYINCPFCDAKIKKDERNCPFCGGVLIK